MTENEKLGGGPNSRAEMIEDRIGELDDRSIELIQSEQRRFLQESCAQEAVNQGLHGGVGTTTRCH